MKFIFATLILAALAQPGLRRLPLNPCLFVDNLDPQDPDLSWLRLKNPNLLPPPLTTLTGELMDLPLALLSLLLSEQPKNKSLLEVVHPPLLLELMLSIMELILEDTELLDGTLTTPTLELMPKDAVKKGLQNRFLGA